MALPLAKKRINPDNAGPIILGWLHKFNLTVRSHTDPDYEFFYTVTTDGGKTVGVHQSKRYQSDYITFQSTISQTAESKEYIKELSAAEKLQAIQEVKLALSQAVMGYSSTNMLEEYTIFKRLPIGMSLTEDRVIDAIWSMEAIVNTTQTLEAIAVRRHKSLIGKGDYPQV
ncbi:MAG: hypothetical protein ACRYGG_01980 [Janthinobacterium lividum]